MGASSVSVAEVLEGCIKKRPGDWNRSDEMRVGAALRMAKWERYRDYQAGILAGLKSGQWRFRPAIPTCPSGVGQR
jgi:hypothetical protein